MPSGTNYPPKNGKIPPTRTRLSNCGPPELPFSTQPQHTAMSGLIEQLGTLRAVGVDGDEKQLQLLLRTAGYNVERAINQ